MTTTPEIEAVRVAVPCPHYPLHCRANTPGCRCVSYLTAALAAAALRAPALADHIDKKLSELGGMPKPASEMTKDEVALFHMLTACTGLLRFVSNTLRRRSRHD